MADLGNPVAPATFALQMLFKFLCGRLKTTHQEIAGTVIQFTFVDDPVTQLHGIARADGSVEVQEGGRPGVDLELRARLEDLGALLMAPQQVGKFVSDGRLVLQGAPRFVEAFSILPSAPGPLPGYTPSAAEKSEVEAVALRERVDRVERVHLPASDLFLERFARTGRPVILTGCLDSWPLLREGLAWLHSRFKEVVVSVRTGDYPDTIYGPEMPVTMEPLDQYLRRIHEPATRDAPPYLANWDVGSLLDPGIDYPGYFHRSVYAEARVWIGPPGAVTPLHRDWTDNFLAQVVGTKRVHLVSPEHCRKLPVREVHPRLDSCVVPGSPRPDVGASGVPTLECTLTPGDMLYLPAGWFHEVSALSMSCSVNFFVNGPPTALGARTESS